MVVLEIIGRVVDFQTLLLQNKTNKAFDSQVNLDGKAHKSKKSIKIKVKEYLEVLKPRVYRLMLNLTIRENYSLKSK